MKNRLKTDQKPIKNRLKTAGVLLHLSVEPQVGGRIRVCVCVCVCVCVEYTAPPDTASNASVA